MEATMRKTYVWDASLSVGIVAIDEQHKQLVAMLGEIQTALFQELSDADIVKYLRQMRDYAAEHFALEEQLMEPHSQHMPNHPHHLWEHREFEDKTGELLMQFVQEGGTAAGWELFTFLGNWLIKHIQGTDQVMAEVLKKQGVH